MTHTVPENEEGRFVLTSGDVIRVRHNGDHVEVRSERHGLVIGPNVTNSIDVTTAAGLTRQQQKRLIAE